MTNRIFVRVLVFLMFLSASFSITYWAVAKYSVQTDFSSSDSYQYIKMYHHEFEGVPQRFQYRVLTPFLASFIGAINERIGLSHFLSKYYENVDQKMMQLNFGILNMICLAIIAFLLFDYHLRFGFSIAESFIAGFLFLNSFFVVNYYTIPNADALSCLFLMWGFWAVLRKDVLGVALSVLIGFFAKETILVILLLSILVGENIISRTTLACLPGIFVYCAFIHWFPSKPHEDGTYIFSVISSQKYFLINFNSFLESFNWYSVIEYVQTFGILWLLFLFGLIKCELPNFLRRASWLMILPFVMPFLQAVTNGRVSFYLFPIVIPISLFALRQLFYKLKWQAIS